ncbi:MAG: hypothetical protein ABMB14_27795 [Myxococcota bacterium]
MGPAPVRPVRGRPLIHVLFGPTRSRRRRALARAGLGGIDAIGRPSFLYLTATRRKRDAVLREFEDRDAFSPEVAALGDWLADRWVRDGDGRVLLTDRGLALVTRRVLDDDPDRWPHLAAIPDRAEAAWALARLDQRLDAAGAVPPDPEVRDVFAAVRARIDRDARAIRRTDAVRATIRRLESVGAPAAPEAVIVDDLFGVPPLDAALVGAACRAWDRAGAAVILASASGRDRGGAEVAMLLGADDAPDRELRVFTATATIRRVAAELVGTGEAEVLLAGEDGPMLIEPWTEFGPPADRTLADAFADGAAVPLGPDDDAARWAGSVAVWNPDDPVTEAILVARALADALRAGVDPRDCAIAVPDPPTWGARLLHVFADHQVPVRLAGGVPVGGTPVARVVRWVVGEALDGTTVDGVCGLADWLGWDLGVDPRAVVEDPRER